MVNYELNIPFRWYLISGGGGNLNNSITAVKKKHRYRFAMGGALNFELYCKNNTLLPFQVFIPNSEVPITKNTFELSSWYICKSSVANPSAGMAPGDFIDVPAQLAAHGKYVNDYLEKTAVKDKGIYLIGCKNGEDGTIFPFEIPCGFWYSAIKMKDGVWAVSEDFYVPNDQSMFENKLTRLDWYNSTDAFGVLYQTGFKNRLWLDADFESDIPTVVEEGITDGLNQFIQTGVQIVDTYQIKDYVPGYIFRAFLHARGVDTFVAWIRGFLYYSFLKVKDAAMNWGDNNVEGTLTVKLEQIDYNDNQTKYGCGSNLQIGSPIPLIANNDVIALYPYVSRTTFSVMDNDQGVGLVVAAIVGVHDADNKVKLTLNGDGTISITQIVNGGFGTQASNWIYTLFDAFNNQAQGMLTIRIQDWTPAADFITLSAFDLRHGVTYWDSGTNATWNLFHNDHFPANGNVVQSVPGNYYSTRGTGNYVTVYADGRWELFIINAGIPLFSLQEVFLIQYYNTPLGAKYVGLNFSWA